MFSFQSIKTITTHNTRTWRSRRRQCMSLSSKCHNTRCLKMTISTHHPPTRMMTMSSPIVFLSENQGRLPDPALLHVKTQSLRMNGDLRLRIIPRREKIQEGGEGARE